MNTNTLPVVQNEQVATIQNKSVTIDVLANDIDSDGDRLSSYTAQLSLSKFFIKPELNTARRMSYFSNTHIIYNHDISQAQLDAHGMPYTNHLNWHIVLPNPCQKVFYMLKNVSSCYHLYRSFLSNQFFKFFNWNWLTK